MSLNRATSGILCSYYGITGYNPADILDARKGAMKRIKRHFDSSGIRILPVSAHDIKQIRSGRSMMDLLRDKINAFHMMRL
jgi:hypothetical protein